MTDRQFQRAESPLEMPASEKREVGGERSLSLIATAGLLLHHRWLLLVTSMALGAMVVGIGLAGQRMYSSTGSFVPQQTDASAAAGISGLAAQFGVSIGQGGLGQSPAFYADLITSRPILERIVDTTYRVHVNDVAVNVTPQKLLGIDGPGGAVSRERTIRAVRPHLRVVTDVKTGVVTFTVTSPWPELSAGIASRILTLINDFNIETRQSQATAQRDFAQSRLTSARTELADAEGRLEEFMQRNRSYSADPQLAVAHDRLTRDVDLRQQIYLSLAQSFEQSRLDAVRNTPMISVIARPELPVIADPRNLALKGLAAVVAGFLAMAGFLVARDMLGSDSETVRDLEGINREIGVMLQPLRRLRRQIPSEPLKRSRTSEM